MFGKNISRPPSYHFRFLLQRLLSLFLSIFRCMGTKPSLMLGRKRNVGMFEFWQASVFPIWSWEKISKRNASPTYIFFCLKGYYNVLIVPYFCYSSLDNFRYRYQNMSNQIPRIFYRHFKKQIVDENYLDARLQISSLSSPTAPKHFFAYICKL